MADEKMRYMAALEGAEIDLKLLARCFTTNECRVAHGEWPKIGTGKLYMLSASSLDLIPQEERRMVPSVNGTQIEGVFDLTWSVAADQTKHLLGAMNGAARLIQDQYKPVSVNSLHKFTLAGEWWGSSVTKPWGDNWRNYPMPSAQEGLPEIVRLWTRAGLKSEAVQFALAMYGTMPITWTMLYMVYEVIRDDMNGDLSSFISKKKESDFRKSANHARQLNQGPRHAFRSIIDPTKLMSLDDGKLIVHHLMNRWLGQKVGKVVT
jgi:hypothetical protein